MKRDHVRLTGNNKLDDSHSKAIVERRLHPRRDSGLCITAVPVNEAGETLGAVLVGHCLDVSDGGIKITLAREATARYLRIEPMKGSMELGFASAVMEILRDSRENGCYLYAGRFVDIHGK